MNRTVSAFLRTSVSLLVVLWLASCLSACAKAPFVWAENIPAERAKPAEDRKDIQPGDVVQVTVVGQIQLSGQHVVGADGTVAIPNVGAVPVAGSSVSVAEKNLVKEISRILERPTVSLVVITRSIEVTILGEVGSPGKVLLKSGDGVASALALAGGINEFGNKNGIYLVRSTEPLRIRFRLKDLLRGGDSARSFALRDGDLLVIE